METFAVYQTDYGICSKLIIFSFFLSHIQYMEVQHSSERKYNKD